jgi:hypothetical protein
LYWLRFGERAMPALMAATFATLAMTPPGAPEAACPPVLAFMALWDPQASCFCRYCGSMMSRVELGVVFC